MRTIKLSKGYVALIDNIDFYKVSKFKWWVSTRAGNTRYAYRMLGRTTQRMHRFILGLRNKQRIEVDHVNGDGLDNRKANLRTCTRSQNLANSDRVLGVSGFRGVYGRENSQAKIGVNRKVIYLGRFGSPVEAARAYDVAAIRYFGAFARLNFPKKQRGFST